MVENRTSRSSVEASIEEAKKFGASPEEARRIHELVAANTSADIVRSFELKFGPDSTDNKAVWVQLLVDDELRPSKNKITELNKLASKIRSVLLRSNLEFWPYVDVRGRS